MKTILSSIFLCSGTLLFSQSWNTTGNSGTDPATDFIGTTDNQPLVFKTNNTEQLRISSAGRFIVPYQADGFGKNLMFGGGNDAIPNNRGITVFGLGSLALVTVPSNVTRTTVFGHNNLQYGGHSNMVFGSESLRNSKIADGNVTMGSLNLNGSGFISRNVAIGIDALNGQGGPRGENAESLSVSLNSAVGTQALSRLRNGTGNTAFGSSSLWRLGSIMGNRPTEDAKLYSYNIAIGYSAGGALWKGSNNILIGHRVMPSDPNESHNELNIGNWIYGKEGDIGIGTQSPQAKFEINGKADHDSGLRFTKMNSSSPTTPNTKLLGIDAQGKVVVAEGSGGSGAGWGLAGNAGTDPATNFIGTTDSQPILFKTNNEEQMRISADGKLGLGTAQFSCTGCSGYRLFVKDGIKTEKVKVNIASANGWADYVFNKDYQLMPLPEVEKHIQEKGHLPNIPSADEVMKEGIDLGAMDAKLLEKIEELTLYSIEQQKKIEELISYSIEQNKKIEDLIKENKVQSREIEELKNK